MGDEIQDRKDTATLVRGAGLNLLTLLSRLGRPAFYLLAARLYAAEFYGLYFLTWTYINLLSRLAVFGLDKTLLRHIAYHNSFGEKKQAVSSARTALFTGSLLSFVISLGCFLFSDFVGPLMGQEGLSVAFRWMAFVIFFQTASGLMLQIPIAHKVMQYQLYIKGLVEPLLLIGFAVLFSFLGLGLQGLCGAHLAALGIVFCCSILPVFKFFPLQVWFDGAIKFERKIFRFSFSMFLIDLIADLNTRLDVLVMGFWVDAKTIAIYAVMTQLASLIPTIRFAFDSIANPFFAELHARGQISRLGEVYKMITRWVMLITIPLILLVVLKGSQIAALVGQEYTQGYLWLLVLILGATAAAFAGLSGYVLVMTGHPGSLLGVNLTTLAISGVGTYFLVRMFGPMGAAIGAAFTVIFAQSFASWRVFQLLKIHAFATNLWKPLLAGCLAAGLAGLLFPFSESTPLWDVLSAVLLIFVFYSIPLFLFGLEEEERQFGVKVYHRVARLFG